MAGDQSEIHIVCGPNGTGKTTFIETVADNLSNGNVEIAPNPDDPTSSESAMTKLKIMRQFINDCLKEDRSVIFETTGAARSLINLMIDARAQGYLVALWYLYLPSPKLSVERVKIRVMQGGHYVPEEDIKRRYQRGIDNLSTFIPLAEHFYAFDHSHASDRRLIAYKKHRNDLLEIKVPEIWEDLCNKNENLVGLAQETATGSATPRP